MSRKDYEKFAEMFKGELGNWSSCDRRRAVMYIIRESAEIFAQDNPRFDHAKFYVASGLTKDGDLP